MTAVGGNQNMWTSVVLPLALQLAGGGQQQAGPQQGYVGQSSGRDPGSLSTIANDPMLSYYDQMNQTLNDQTFGFINSVLGFDITSFGADPGNFDPTNPNSIFAGLIDPSAPSNVGSANIFDIMAGGGASSLPKGMEWLHNPDGDLLAKPGETASA